jgi:hypothetical protein
MQSYEYFRRFFVTSPADENGAATWSRKFHVSPGVERKEFTLVASRCATLRGWKDLTMFTKSGANYRSHFRV